MRFRARDFVLTPVPILLVALAICAPRIAYGQKPPSETPPDARKEKASPDKLRLSDATRVSTEEAARRAAKVKTQGDERPPAKSDGEVGGTDSSTSSQVSELQPSVKAKVEKSAARDESVDRSDRKLKKIHGSVYGSAGSGSRSTNAEIGASNKSGKTHVYVESGRTENKEHQ